MTTQEPPEESDPNSLICVCEKHMRHACASDGFYKEKEGKRYCVLHYPGDEKAADFQMALHKKQSAQDYDFRGVWFPKGVRFKEILWSGNTDFSSASFNEDIDFSGVDFQVKALFNSASFNAVVDFSRVTFRAAADFSGACFNKDAEFGKAHFNKDADFSRTCFDGDAVFNGAIFSGNAVFNGAIFSGDAVFGSVGFSAIFSADAVFHSACFSGNAVFRNARFSAVAFFNFAKFSGSADFKSAEFSVVVVFINAIFSGNAGFEYAIFSANAVFHGVRFSWEADFSGARFSADAVFRSAKFSRDAVFRNAIFSGNAIFRNAIFSGNAIFGEATFKDYFYFAGEPQTRTFGDQQQLNFEFTHFEKPDRVSFHTLDLKPHWFVNVDSRKFEFTDIEFNYDLKGELEKLKKAKLSAPHRLLAIACRQLADNAETNHRYLEASRLRYSSFEAGRIERFYGFVFWRLDWWYWLASGYGERVLQAFIVFVVLIGLFTIGYKNADFDSMSKTTITKPMPAAASASPGIPDTQPRRLGWRESALYSFNVSILQKPEPKPIGLWGNALVSLETVLGPAQAALLALALRRRFMR